MAWTVAMRNDDSNNGKLNFYMTPILFIDTTTWIECEVIQNAIISWTPSIRLTSAPFPFVHYSVFGTVNTRPVLPISLKPIGSKIFREYLLSGSMQITFIKPNSAICRRRCLARTLPMPCPLYSRRTWMPPAWPSTILKQTIVEKLINDNHATAFNESFTDRTSRSIVPRRCMRPHLHSNAPDARTIPTIRYVNRAVPLQLHVRHILVLVSRWCHQVDWNNIFGYRNGYLSFSHTLTSLRNPRQLHAANGTMCIQRLFRFQHFSISMLPKWSNGLSPLHTRTSVSCCSRANRVNAINVHCLHPMMRCIHSCGPISKSNVWQLANSSIDRDVHSIKREFNLQ